MMAHAKFGEYALGFQSAILDVLAVAARDGNDAAIEYARNNHIAPIGYEARCAKCGQTFNPDGFDDLVHVMNAETDEECGGRGQITGAWW